MAEQIQAKRHGAKFRLRAVKCQGNGRAARRPRQPDRYIPAAGGAVFESTSNVIMKPFVPLNS